jgi:GTP:adenosylcobinamide-phosphate guanylyltransferase
MDVIITCGGIPKTDEPLFKETRGGLKVLLKLGGKPMIQWVLDALSAVPELGRVIAVGLPDGTDLKTPQKLITIPNQHGLLENILAACQLILEKNPQAQKALLVSGDLPGLTGEMIAWMVEAINKEEADFYYTIVPRTLMEKTFPLSKRTYLRLGDGEFCGGDITALNPQLAKSNLKIWQKLIATRKNPIRQASLFGFNALFQLFTGRMTVQGAEKMVSNRIGIRGKVLEVPYAEMGMDVDKPFQLDLLRAYLEKRTSG